MRVSLPEASALVALFRVHQRRAFRERLYRAFVDGQPAFFGMLIEHLELGLAGRQFRGWDVELDGFRLGVDDDAIAILHKADRAADRGLRRDLANDETLVDEAGKLAIGDERHIGAKTRAVER